MKDAKVSATRKRFRHARTANKREQSPETSELKEARDLALQFDELVALIDQFYARGRTKTIS
jgi:hypothetical protein